MFDNLSDIKELKYNITKNNNNSLKFSNNNDYLINITNFMTNINPDNEVFYKQNVSEISHLKPYVYEKNNSRMRWALNRNFL